MAGTPVVYDLKHQEIVDHSDADWLANLLNSS